MYARWKRPLSPSQRKAEKKEIARQVKELSETVSLELEAVFMWAAHEKWRKGKKSLREYYDFVADCIDALVEHYEVGEDGQKFILLYKLKEIGVDLEAWGKERRKRVTIRIDDEGSV
jgi:hypothetical protein